MGQAAVGHAAGGQASGGNGILEAGLVLLLKRGRPAEADYKKCRP